MNDETTQQIVQVCNDIVETVTASPYGVPVETLFSTLKLAYPAMTRWQFNYTLIDTLIEAGQVKRIGQRLYTPNNAHTVLNEASNTKQ